MRIEAYNQITQVYKASKPVKASGSAKTSASDQVVISSLGKDYQSAKKAVADASDVRSELTGPLKERVANGSYNVSSQDFASKLLEKYQSMQGF